METYGSARIKEDNSFEQVLVSFNAIVNYSYLDATALQVSHVHSCILGCWFLTLHFCR